MTPDFTVEYMDHLKKEAAYWDAIFSVIAPHDPRRQPDFRDSHLESFPQVRGEKLTPTPEWHP